MIFSLIYTSRPVSNWILRVSDPIGQYTANTRTRDGRGGAWAGRVLSDVHHWDLCSVGGLSWSGLQYWQVNHRKGVGQEPGWGWGEGGECWMGTTTQDMLFRRQWYGLLGKGQMGGRDCCLSYEMKHALQMLMTQTSRYQWVSYWETVDWSFCLRSRVCARELLSIKKESAGGNDLSNVPPKSLHAKKKLATPPPSNHGRGEGVGAVCDKTCVDVFW